MVKEILKQSHNSYHKDKQFFKTPFGNSRGYQSIDEPTVYLAPLKNQAYHFEGSLRKDRCTKGPGKPGGQQHNRRKRARESRERNKSWNILFYEVLITCKGLFVIAEFRNLLSCINRRPTCLESLAQSVFKMCLHPQDSDPS